MGKSYKLNFPLVIAGTLLLVAYLPAVLWWTSRFRLPVVFTYMRNFIHVGLLIAWVVSLCYRIIHAQVRRYLVSIALLMLFLILLKTLKYYFVFGIDPTRALWYAYYIPLLLIPTLAVLIALLLGKPENYQVPGRAKILLIFAAILILLVLTNDLHNIIFSFPAGQPQSDRTAIYNVAYYLVLGWECLAGIAAVVLFISKCRIPQSRTVLWSPLLLLSLSILYGVLYFVVWPPLRLFLNDPTVTLCLLYVLILESCIWCGLIQANTHYRRLLNASTIGAQITDKDFKLLYSAKNAKSFDADTLRAAAKEPVILAGGIRLSEAPIRGAHVFWQEDVSKLLAVLTELHGTGEELQSYGELLQEENRQKARRRKLEEQKRLFESVRAKTASQVALLTKLAGDLETAGSEETARMLLGKIAVVGAYLKRRSNLVFLAEQTDASAAEELRLCLNESAASLRLCGVECAYSLDKTMNMSLFAAALFYDFFETAVELSLDDISGLLASFSGENDYSSLSLMIRTGMDMTPIGEKFPAASAKEEDGVWYCTLSVRDGGVDI